MWQCDECGSRSEWTGAHRWYGSLKQMDEGRNLHVTCSNACWRASVAKGLVGDGQMKAGE